MEYAPVFVYAVDRFPDLAAQEREFLPVGDLRNGPCLKVFLHLPEYPGGSEAGAPYHHAVDSISVEGAPGLLGRLDVAVAYDGDLNAWIRLHLSDECPVGLAGIHLRACAPVDGQGLYAAVLQPWREVGDDLVLAVPAQTGLDSDRNTDGIHHRLGDGQHLLRIAQHAGSGSFRGHFLHRASEVYVEYIGAGLLHYLRRLHHGLRLAAVYLYGHRALPVVDGQFAGSGVDVAHEGFGRHEFGVDHRRPLLAADKAEGRVGDVFHRCQHHGALS